MSKKRIHKNDLSFYNSERYADPTAFKALSNACKKPSVPFMPLVYICSPYSGDIAGNTEKARIFSRFAVDRNYIPIAPHLLFPQFMSEESERELALYMGTVLLSKCKEVWVFGGKITDGMSKEIAYARKKNKTIRYFYFDREFEEALF